MQKYTNGMVMERKGTSVVINNIYRWISNFSIADGVARGVVSGKEVKVKCAEGEAISDIKRRLVLENDEPRYLCINGHHVIGCRTENNGDGTVTVTGYVDGEFTSIRYKAAAMDEQGNLYHGKPWLRTAREGLVAEYEKHHKTKSITVFREKTNMGLAMCDDDFRVSLINKGIDYVSDGHFEYLGKRLNVSNRVTQFEVMTQMKRIAEEVNQEVKDFFDNFIA